MKPNIRHDWPAYLLGFCFLSTLVMGSYWIFSRYVFPNRPVQIFVEMKVLDEQGHPVAGAEIYENDKRIGVTDSFGEWSQFLVVRVDSSLPLVVRKQRGTEKIGAIKNILIPSSILLESENRIRTNVRLGKNWELPLRKP